MVEDSAEDAWAFIRAQAQATDSRCRRIGSWVPPILGDLVDAAHATTLRRFHPFTSMNYFCMASGPRWWLRDGGHIAPALIALHPSAGYAVWPEQPADDDAEPLMTTGDAHAAVAELERLLAAWQPG
jgi:hypothetical protein